jgi:hypothetical protein
MERLEQQQEEAALLAAAQDQARAEEEISGRLPREVLTINRRLDMQQQSMDKMQMDMSTLVAMVTQISTSLGKQPIAPPLPSTAPPGSASFSTPPFKWYQEFSGKQWEELLPDSSPDARDLVTRLVCFESGSRATATEV